MTRQKKVAIGFGIAALLSALTFAVVASAKGGDDKNNCPDGMMPNPLLKMPRVSGVASGIRGLEGGVPDALLPKCVPIKCAPGYHRDPLTGACAKDTPDDPGPGFDPWDPGDDDTCPPGMIRNAARLKPLAQGLKGAALEAELEKYPLCVPIDCPDGYKRNEFGDCIANPSDPSAPKCPEGMRWSAHAQSCVPICGPNEYLHAASGKCLPKPDEPTDDVDDIVKPVPIGGNFYQVRKGDIFFGTKVSDGTGSKGLSICYMALRRAAFDACVLEGGMGSEKAWAYVNAHASIIGHEIKSLRPYLDILTCSWWNDETSATWKFTYGKATPGPQGRALPLNPQNAPNLDRLRAHEQPARNIPLGKPADKPSKNKPGSAAYGVNDSWRSYPLVWISEIELGAYFNSGFTEITAQGLEWPDGSPRSVPPPWVQVLGIFDATGTIAQGTMMGCLGSSKVVSS